MRLPLRRIVLGFAVGASAGWVASLLRRPKDAPPGTGADAAEHMPVEEFGDPVEEVAGEQPSADDIAQEPTAPAEAYEAEAGGDAAASDTAPAEAVDTEPASEERKPPRKALPETVTPPPGTEARAVGAGESEPAKPTPRRRARKDAVSAVAQPVSEAAREGRAEVAERLAGLDEAVTPPAAPVAPEARRRRKRTE